MGVRYTDFFGEGSGHQIELTMYGTTKYFERLARTYRIFNRDGFGLSAHYTGRFTVGGSANEFTAGVDAFSQTGPIEEYRNIGGTKGDNLEALTNESIANLGAFLMAGGLIYAVNDGGRLSLFEAAPTRFNLLAQAQVLKGRECWGPMALAGGRLLVRDTTRLACLEVGQRP